MRNIFIFLLVFAFAAAAYAQTYVYQGENFSSLSTAGAPTTKWCYFDANNANSPCGAQPAANGAGAWTFGENANPPYKSVSVVKGNYQVKIKYLDRTTHINPKVKVGTKEYVLNGSYSVYTEEVQKDVVTLEGDETITFYLTQINSTPVGNKFVGIDYVKLEHFNKMYVDDDWICNNGTENLTPCFNSTTNALKYASDGDIVYVFNGSYPDTAIMTQNLAVYGESTEGVVFGGISFYKSNNDSAPNNVKIDRLTVKGNGIRFNASAKNAQNIFLSNLLIYNNSAPAINVYDGIGSFFLINSTISNNNLGSAYGCEICLNGSSNMFINSSIVYGTNYSIRGNSGNLNIQKAVVYGVYGVSGMSLVQSQVSNLDPKFVDSRGNFTLFAGSPAIGLAGSGSNAGFWQGNGIEQEGHLPELSAYFWMGIIVLFAFVFFIFIKRKSA
jgi:hypothetical protein